MSTRKVFTDDAARDSRIEELRKERGLTYNAAHALLARATWEIETGKRPSWAVNVIGAKHMPPPIPVMSSAVKAEIGREAARRVRARGIREGSAEWLPAYRSMHDAVTLERAAAMRKKKAVSPAAQAQPKKPAAAPQKKPHTFAQSAARPSPGGVTAWDRLRAAQRSERKEDKT